MTDHDDAFSFHRGSLPRVVVNGQRVDLLDMRWLNESNVGDSNKGVVKPLSFELLIATPEPSDLLVVAKTVRVQLDNGDPAQFQVTSAQLQDEVPYYGAPSDWPSRTYRIELMEYYPNQGGEADTIEVVYRTAFQTIAMRVQIRALGQILQDKGVITAEEYRKYVDKVMRSSFLDFASTIVAEEEAKAMQQGMLRNLDDNLEVMVPETEEATAS